MKDRISVIWHKLISLIDKIRLKNNEELSLMSEVINSMQREYWDQYEIDELKKIEKLRVSYSNSSKQIALVDYGAGKSNDKRTDMEMNEGIEVTNSISNIYNNASSPKKWGELMFRILKLYKPIICIELGTNLGISAAYGSIALKLNEKAKFITIEGAPELAAIAGESLQKLGNNNCIVEIGKFQDILSQLLIKHNPVDFAFIDGHHDEKATFEYFEMFLDALSDNAILLFDDINWSDGMKRAWEKIKKDKRVSVTIDFYNRGVCIVPKSCSHKKNYKVWID